MTDGALDPLTGKRVLVVANRQSRPNLPTDGCPFCPGGIEAPDGYESTHHFVNRWPPLPDGRAEVLLYSPEHDATFATLTTDDARAVVDMWVERTEVLGARDDVAYVFIFENRGPEVGATIRHPHGQVYAFDLVPPAAQTELDAPACALCDDPGDDRVVFERDGWRAWVPQRPVYPYELLIAPVTHRADLPSLDDGERTAFGDAMVAVTSALDAHFEAEAPLMMWIHQRPSDGGEWPSAHVHAHITPIWRRPNLARFVAAAELGSEVYFDPVEPSQAAADLRAHIR